MHPPGWLRLEVCIDLWGHGVSIFWPRWSLYLIFTLRRGDWGGVPRELQRLLSLIGYGSSGGVCGRSLTAGKILFTGRQTCSLYLVLWLCGVLRDVQAEGCLYQVLHLSGQGIQTDTVSTLIDFFRREAFFLEC